VNKSHKPLFASFCSRGEAVFGMWIVATKWVMGEAELRELAGQVLPG